MTDKHIDRGHTEIREDAAPWASGAGHTIIREGGPGKHEDAGAPLWFVILTTAFVTMVLVTVVMTVWPAVSRCLS